MAIVVSCILFFLITYVSISVLISISVNNLLKECNEIESEYSQFEGRFENEQLFLGVKYVTKTYISEADKPYAIDKLNISFPFTIHLFTSATCSYFYTHTVIKKTPNGTKLLSGSYDIPVTLSLILIDWKWRIVSFNEAP